eukprot:5410714-Pyramimonas_sp.AAC.1
MTGEEGVAGQFGARIGVGPRAESNTSFPAATSGPETVEPRPGDKRQNEISASHANAAFSTASRGNAAAVVVDAI